MRNWTLALALVLLLIPVSAFNFTATTPLRALQLWIVSQ